MEPSSRTPDGEPNRCPVCGKDLRIEPSRPSGDAPCPHCGNLLWFQTPAHLPDDPLIEHAKRQIRSLVREIAQLAQSDIQPEAFFGEFLPRVVQALAAIGGVVWTVEDQGRLALAYQINLQEARLRDRQDDQIRHGRLLHKALKLPNGEGLLVPPHCGAGHDDEAGNTTDFLLVLAALKTGIQTVGLVEIFQRPEAGPTTQKGYLRFLLQMCDLARNSPALRRLESRPQVREPQRVPWWKFWKRL